MTRAGRFLTFEGVDGSGKSTQMRLLAARLRDTGRKVVETVEPGGTEIGRQIRRVLLDAANVRMTPEVELLLYFASRAQNVDEVIRPALAEGRVVISDRFTDSTTAYQGFGRGLGEQVVADLHRIACGDLTPDLAIFLDIDVETGLARAHGRNMELFGDEAVESRMDEQSTAFYRKVREGYLALVDQAPKRWLVVNANRGVEAVASDVWEGVKDQLGV